MNLLIDFFVLPVRTLRATALMVAVAVFPASVAAQAACVDAVPAISSLLRAVHDKQKNVGLAAAVMHRGQLVYSEGMGFADIENRIPFTDRKSVV